MKEKYPAKVTIRVSGLNRTEVMVVGVGWGHPAKDTIRVSGLNRTEVMVI